jgi:hypothetical protein
MTWLWKFRWLGWLIVLFMPLLLGTAKAGMDVSLEREFLKLRDVQEQLEALPAYRESEELKQQILSLQQRIEQLAMQNRESIEAERGSLRRQIDGLQARLADLQKIILQFREQTNRGERERFFPDVRHRLAAFTFDDPHETGLGDVILFLLSKKLLFSARVSSFAIVSYRQGADRSAPGELAYFDRVDAITKDQKFLLAVWGRVSRTEQGLRIQSFLQVPADADGGPFVQKVRLPKAMGAGTLTARLKPDRIMVQDLEIGPDGVDALKKAAADIATLRARPSPSGKITGRLKEDVPYRIVDSKQDWVQLKYKGGGGWTSIDEFCTGVCRALLDVATFTNDMIALAAGSPARPVPQRLTSEAKGSLRQLTGLLLLSKDPRKAAKFAGLPLPELVADNPDPQPSNPEKPIFDNAGFANLLAVARIAAELQEAGVGHRKFDDVVLDQQTLKPIVHDLAMASVAHPGDVDIVENLAVLFAALGDEKRRVLALEIAANLRKR